MERVSEKKSSHATYFSREAADVEPNCLPHANLTIFAAPIEHISKLGEGAERWKASARASETRRVRWRGLARQRYADGSVYESDVWKANHKGRPPVRII